MLPSQLRAAGKSLGVERAEALQALRDLLGDRPEGWDPEEWSVVHALLDPDRYLAQVTGVVPRQYSLGAQARACFPGVDTPTALRQFRDVSTRPHVVDLVSSFRSLELLDVMEHRNRALAALHAGIDQWKVFGSLTAKDPSSASKLILSVVAAVRALQEMVPAVKEGDGSSVVGSKALDLQEVDQVIRDMVARKEEVEEP